MQKRGAEDLGQAGSAVIEVEKDTEAVDPLGVSNWQILMLMQRVD